MFVQYGQYRDCNVRTVRHSDHCGLDNPELFMSRKQQQLVGHLHGLTSMTHTTTSCCAFALCCTVLTVPSLHALLIQRAGGAQIWVPKLMQCLQQCLKEWWMLAVPHGVTHRVHHRSHCRWGVARRDRCLQQCPRQELQSHQCQKPHASCHAVTAVASCLRALVHGAIENSKHASMDACKGCMHMARTGKQAKLCVVPPTAMQVCERMHVG